MDKGKIMFKRIIKVLVISIIVFQQNLSAASTGPGKFTSSDYKRALWMTTRFYGAQRCGLGPNWLLMEHQFKTTFTHDADVSSNNYDLEGGWFDCGDHVLFGQTFFYSTYLLAKAYDMVPCGFHDLYNGNYGDYLISGNLDLDGGMPNGIPDLLEELKYATDWIIKATPNASTFYYQKGEGAKDHKAWVTAGKMSTLSVDSGGEPRKIFKNPDDGVMASFAAATLAIMSRVYKKYDPVYAQTCLDHAKFAYSYAKPKKNNAAGAGDGGFYGPHSKPSVVAFIVGASEMFKATGEASYKTDAQADQNQIIFHNYSLDYSNTHDLAPLAMGTSLGDSNKLNQTKTMFLDNYTKGLNSEGLCTKGNSSWGALRYPANEAFLAGMWAKAKKTAVLDTFIFKQVDYILGANNAKQSFIVGFCSGCTKQPQHPHHRNVYLRDDNPPDSVQQAMEIPERNKFFGYMVGGSWNSGDYKDNIRQYAFTEGGLDYNAGLVGALAYIVNKLDPADTSKMVGISSQSLPMRSPPTFSFITRHMGNSFIIGIPGDVGISSWSIYDQRGIKVYEKRSSGPSIQWKPSSAGGIFYCKVLLTNGCCRTGSILGLK
jgi:endoglucanase